MAQDYNNLNETLLKTSESLNLRIESFKEFVENQGNDILESISTILYYFNKLSLKSIDKNKILNILGYLKPHLSKEIIEESFEKIKEYGLLDYNLIARQNPFNKEIVIDKLDGLISVFETFENCSNRTLLLGSLDYFRIALKKEDLGKNKKNELLKTVYDYGEYVENYYFINYTLADNFSYCDLRPINERFDKLQYYISDLGILPRLYDPDVDLNIFC